MIKIIPAILTKTEEEFMDMVKKIEPYAETVHLDIADGEFVPNKTIAGYDEIGKVETGLNFEVHLMIKNPELVMDKWLVSGVSSFLVHWESTENFNDLISQIQANGREAGCVLNPGTDYKVIEPYLDRLSKVQFMTVNPGFYGSPFLPEILEKVADFHRRYPAKAVQVDGGVNPETLKLVETSGASSAAVGSYIFKSDNIEKAFTDLNA